MIFEAKWYLFSLWNVSFRPFNRIFFVAAATSLSLVHTALINWYRRWIFLPAVKRDKTSDCSTNNNNTIQLDAGLFGISDWIERKLKLNWHFWKENSILYTYRVWVRVRVFNVQYECINVQLKWTSNCPMPFHKYELNLLFNPISACILFSFIHTRTLRH